MNSIRELLESAVGEKVFPGASLVVARGNSILVEESVGRFFPEGMSDQFGENHAVSLETVYDLDGLSGSLVTATLLMKAVDDGLLAPSNRVARFVQGFGVLGKSQITVSQVTDHISGLPSVIPFFQEMERADHGSRLGMMMSRGATEYVYNRINRGELKHEPGHSQSFSEVGMILLGHLLEEITAKRLDKLAQDSLFSPLRLTRTGYVDLGLLRRGKLEPDYGSVAPSEECGWRKRLIQGEVRDENTWAMGGVSGHAGVFSTAREVSTLLQTLLVSLRGGNSFLSAVAAESFLVVPSELRKSAWYRCWSHPKAAFGTAPPEQYSSSRAVNSFSGSGVWFDPIQGLSAVFLTNRAMPSRSNKKIQQFWPQLIESVWKEIG